MSRTPIEHYVTIADKRLCYFEWPGDDDEVVLLLHATGFHARCWDQVVNLLPTKTHVIALDMVGHGRSDNQGPFTWSDFATDTTAFVRELELERIVVAGHSMGGYCAMYAAANLQERVLSLVLVDPVVLSPDEYEDQSISQAPSIEEHPIARRRNRWPSPDAMFENFKTRHPFSLWQPEVLKDYCEYGLVPVDNEYELACPPKIEASIYMGTSKKDISLYFPLIFQPTIVMRAEQRVGPREQMDFSKSPTWPELASILPNATDRYMPDLTHFMPMQAPARVAEEIGWFLSD